ncbi:hypothetical protein OOK41_31690 [Micromonospora sp. NBC_01655]|uniref:hypothetical protein n=1 Tax=Micromonospora sp. NBC_01655 TaxID=2975983 RepID=UPI002256854F|nr:hypothetical protein [Micromonospora sp. NBC_01655]MCX4474825.1 hypothetical protein [Micromonospora sp. NBC_01655]
MPTTTDRGLGWEHQQARARALAVLKPGTPCHKCGHPMDKATQKLDLDHLRPRVYGGTGGPRRLAHASCNRREGQAIGQARRRVAARAQQPAVNSRPW